jgi:hypothetical protein
MGDGSMADFRSLALVKRLLLKALPYPMPLRARVARGLIRRFSLFPYEDRMAIGAVDRPPYGYCIFQAAKLAKALGYRKISVIEFGCGGGNGLLVAEAHIAQVAKLFQLDVELYGFDMGSGLPSPRDYRDMPYYFRSGLYEMDRQSLGPKLKRAKLIIGDVEHTCATFIRDYNPAPIGCMLHDLDYYSSTSAALALLDSGSSHFLPRVFMYFDDIIVDNDAWLCTDFTGERLAIEEFNRTHGSQKISKNYYLPLRYRDQRWPEQIYVYHDFTIRSTMTLSARKSRNRMSVP